jgi:hypothetical protein
MPNDVRPPATVCAVALLLQHTTYVRSHDEDCELGLLDIVTEGYNPEMEAELAAEEAAAERTADDSEAPSASS